MGEPFDATDQYASVQNFIVPPGCAPQMIHEARESASPPYASAGRFQHNRTFIR
jgi:hypothetical protein